MFAPQETTIMSEREKALLWWKQLEELGVQDILLEKMGVPNKSSLFWTGRTIVKIWEQFNKPKPI